MGGDASPEDVLAYAMVKDDGKVGPTLTWLLESGFVLVRGSGGRDAPFGNLELVFRRGDTVVRIGYDRTWELGLGRGADRYALDTCLGVMNGTEVAEVPSIDDPFPRIEWHELPRAVEWLESGDREEALREYAAREQAARLRGLYRPKPPRANREDQARQVRNARLKFAARMFGLAVASVLLDRLSGPEARRRGEGPGDPDAEGGRQR